MRKVAHVISLRGKLLPRMLLNLQDTISYNKIIILRVLVAVGTSKT